MVVDENKIIIKKTHTDPNDFVEQIDAITTPFFLLRKWGNKYLHNKLLFIRFLLLIADRF